MEVICINGKFTADQLSFYNQYGVVTPKQDSMYNIRETIRHTTGEVGFRLEEIMNPEVPIKHPILGIIYMEPSWSSTRFSHLNGGPINKQEIDELITNPEKILK